MITCPYTKLKSLLEQPLVLSSPITVKLQGKYRFEVKRNGEVVEDTGWVPNLILNQGRNYLGVLSVNSGLQQFSRYAHVGTGTSAATATQTVLDNKIATQESQSQSPPLTTSGSPNWVFTSVWNYPFPQGAVVGTISEVGVGWNTTGTLFSRARMVDGSNNPTSLTLTSVDQLTVYYALSLVPDLTPGAGTVTLEGTVHNWTSYWTEIDQIASSAFYGISNGYPFMSIGAQFVGSPIGNVYGTAKSIPGNVLTTAINFSTYDNDVMFMSYNNGTTVSVTYAPDSYQLVNTIVVPPAVGNTTGGIKILEFYNTFGYAIYLRTLYEFSPPIAKTNTKRLTIQYVVNWTT